MFVNNGLFILPITRGDYIVSEINAYHNFGNYDSPIIYRIVPEYIQSLTASSITSEAKALNIIVYVDSKNNAKSYIINTMECCASTVQSWLKWVEQLITK